MRPTVTNRVACAVGRSVCHTRETCKMAEPIEMSFGLQAQMGPRNHDCGPEVPRDVVMATNFGTQFAIIGFVWMTATRLLVMEGVWVVGQQNADTADTLQLRDVMLWQPFLAFCIWGEHWCHLVNMTEPFVYSGDADSRQITLTSCYYHWLEWHHCEFAAEALYTLTKCPVAR